VGRRAVGAAAFGITLQWAPTAGAVGLFGAVVAAGMLASLVPGWRAYRLSLADGLSPRTAINSLRSGFAPAGPEAARPAFE
jgi:hypothetical protein